jgi:hypothetical protein
MDMTYRYTAYRCVQVPGGTALFFRNNSKNTIKFKIEKKILLSA